MPVPSVIKRIVPWSMRDRLRRLQQQVDPRRSVRVPLHAGGCPAEPPPSPPSPADPAALAPASPASANEAIWDEKYEKEISSAWSANPTVNRAIQQRQTGDPDRFWLGWLFEEHLDLPVERVLSIGCGNGGHETMIAHQGWATEIHAFDASSTGIEQARADADRLGLTGLDFRVSTFETFAEEGPDRPIYDVVLFAGSLHHVRDLEGVLSRVRRCLRGDGRILFNEYVGPLYTIFPPERVEVMNRVLHTIPAEFKRAPNIEWRNPTIDEVMRNDPTEAVRSSILLDVLGFYFDIEVKVDFGGGILHPMFDLLDGARLADGSPESEAMLQQLIATEDELTASGEIASDMCLGIARHKR